MESRDFLAIFFYCAFQKRITETKEKIGGKHRKQKRNWKIIVKFIVLMAVLRTSFTYRVFGPRV